MIGNDWDEKLSLIWNSEGFKKFYNVIEEEYNSKTIFPPKEDIFRALKLTPYSKVKVVVVGQDPYPGINQANGLSFSVHPSVPIPRSLKNIYQELHNDLGCPIPLNGDLTKWAKEGVLMLNAVLTVEKDKIASHKDLGWQRFTDYIIKLINLKEEPVVFILWGNYAKEKSALVTNPKHFIVTSAHPSPMSASKGFFGSKPFSKTNDFLIRSRIKPIDWQL